MEGQLSNLLLNGKPLRTLRRLWTIGVIAGLVVIAACSRESTPAPQSEEPVVETVQSVGPTATMTSTATEPPPPTDTPVPPESPIWPAIVLAETLSGLKRPVDFANAGDGSGRLYVVEQAGLVQLFSDGVKGETPFLDVRDRVDCCGEKGLLGIAFPPDFATSRAFYVNYTTILPGSLHTRVSRFYLRDDAPPGRFRHGRDHSRVPPAMGQSQRRPPRFWPRWLPLDRDRRRGQRRRPPG